MVKGTYCMGSCKSNSHTTTTNPADIIRIIHTNFNLELARWFYRRTFLWITSGGWTYRRKKKEDKCPLDPKIWVKKKYSFKTHQHPFFVYFNSSWAISQFWKRCRWERIVEPKTNRDIVNDTECYRSAEGKVGILILIVAVIQTNVFGVVFVYCKQIIIQTWYCNTNK